MTKTSRLRRLLRRPRLPKPAFKTLRIGVTGGTGFVGAALIDQLLEQRFDVAALARGPRRLKRAGDICVIEGDLENEIALASLAKGADLFAHLAGVTHARHDADYAKINVEGAARAAKAAAAAGARFIHISSMSARQPDLSPYARSKFDSEAAVRRASNGNAWLALRLPAVYGPGDKATLPYFKLVKSGLALEPRTRPPARASILYVADAAAAIIAAAKAPAGAVYEVGDDREDGRTWSEIGAALGAALGKTPRTIRAPRAAVRAYHGAVRAIERALRRNPSLRSGQINEFFHPDWVARDNLLSAAVAWRPQTPLKEGFAKTALWYQENGLL